VLLNDRVLHRELYRFAEGADIVWEQAVADPPLIRLKVRRAGLGMDSGSGRFDSIEAALGLDHQSIIANF
jgi:hypothetical protein